MGQRHVFASYSWHAGARAAGKPCWSYWAACTCAHLEHVTEWGFFQAQVRRKPLSETRDWSVLRDLINKGKISLKKGAAAVSKERSRHDSSPAYQRHEAESQNRSEVMSGKSMSPSSHCKFKTSLLLHGLNVALDHFFSLSAPLLFCLSSYLSAIPSANFEVTTVLFTGLQTERETLINQSGVRLAPCGLTLL